MVAWGYLSLQYQDLVELMSNNRGRGNTAGAAGCPQVFIPASLELGWKLSNELMSKELGTREYYRRRGLSWGIYPRIKYSLAGLGLVCIRGKISTTI